MYFKFLQRKIFIPTYNLTRYNFVAKAKQDHGK